MKKLVYFIGVLLVFSVLSGQTTYAQHTKTLSKKEKRRIERLRKEKAKEKNLAASRAHYMEMLKNKDFVFQADYVITPRGTTYTLSPDINFLAVVGNRMIVQFGLDGYPGPNGAGGITVKGHPKGYTFTPGKKKNNMSVTSNMILIGPGQPPHIGLTVSDDGTGQLQVQLGYGRTLILHGQLITPKKAKIFVGQSLY